MIAGEWTVHPPEAEKRPPGKEINSMNILLWLALGALAGWLAGLMMGGERRGILGNVIVGILGSVVGGFVASLLGLGGVDGFNLYSLLVAVGGACLLLWSFGMVRRRAEK